MHPAALECRGQAESTAPRFLSRQETDDAVKAIRSASGINHRRARATLAHILPEHILLHKSFDQHESRLLQSVTSLLLSTDDVDQEQAALLSDLRSLNVLANGTLESKFDVYWEAGEKVLEMSGGGAHRRRHTIGEDAERTVNTVYSPSINSLTQLANRIKKYLVEEKKLEEGKDFHIPSLESLRRQFCPSHENRKLATTCTGRFNAKRTLQSRSSRPYHAHAHYAAAQKLLWRHHITKIRKQLEIEEMDVESPVNESWEYYVDMLGLDDKCGIIVVPVPAVR